MKYRESPSDFNGDEKRFSSYPTQDAAKGRERYMDRSRRFNMESAPERYVRHDVRGEFEKPDDYAHDQNAGYEKGPYDRPLSRYGDRSRNAGGFTDRSKRRVSSENPAAFASPDRNSPSQYFSQSPFHTNFRDDEVLGNQPWDSGPMRQEFSQGYSLGTPGWGENYESYRNSYLRPSWPTQTAQPRRLPRGYKRTDERIYEEVCERLSNVPGLDPTDVSVEVKEGTVTLEGTIDSRYSKHAVENIADSVCGTKDVINHLRIRSHDHTTTSKAQPFTTRHDSSEKSTNSAVRNESTSKKLI